MTDAVNYWAKITQNISVKKSKPLQDCSDAMRDL